MKIISKQITVKVKSQIASDLKENLEIPSVLATMAGRKLASDRKKKRIPLVSRKVDRWRFFTHLARRASICIKLIGSPYWLLLFRSNRDQKRERREKARTTERGLCKKDCSSFFLPLSSTTWRGNKKQALCGKLLRYSLKIRIPYRGNSRQVE